MSRSALSFSVPPTDAVLIRPAYPEDLPALARLAALDSQRLPAGPYLVAERHGEALAALALPSGRAIADPFAPTADLVALLRLQAREAARADGADASATRDPRAALVRLRWRWRAAARVA